MKKELITIIDPIQYLAPRSYKFVTEKIRNQNKEFRNFTRKTEQKFRELSHSKERMLSFDAFKISFESNPNVLLVKGDGD